MKMSHMRLKNEWTQSYLLYSFWILDSKLLLWSNVHLPFTSYLTTTYFVKIQTLLTRRISSKYSLFNPWVIPIDNVTLVAKCGLKNGITLLHQLWCSRGYVPYSLKHCACNSTSSDAVHVTCLRVGITVPKTALALMQYRLLALELASLCLQLD